MTMKRQAVDIVVPIYNGYEDLVRCTDSLKRHTDLTLDRVILIDDCSPDERIWPLCGKLAAEGGFIALRNEKNRGFSANVNKGLAFSQNDTILLNSDTIVTRGWVDKLNRCAYSSRRAATVTPLSNAATLASVPEPFIDNKIPEGFTVDSYADLVERVSLHYYPRVTVAVGFCMYVKQEAYLAAGPFDAETFGRGYGEENDFCNRCGMLGYIHLLCDDTFIYHKGTGSFDTEEKKRLLEEHTRILKERYPDQMKENDIYSATNPNQDLSDNLKMYTALENGRRNILYFLHLDFRETAEKNIGGTQLHVKDLVDGLRDSFNVFVLSRDGDYIRLTAYIGKSERGEAGELSFRFASAEEHFPFLRDEKQEELLTTILRVFRISLVHVHHTQGFGLDIYYACKKLGIGVIATLHDYYYACPTIKLLRDDEKFCPSEGTFVERDRECCRRCLQENCSLRTLDMVGSWREESGKALDLCSAVIFPSESAKEIMLSVFPFLKDKSLVIGHGTDQAGTGSSHSSLFRKSGKSAGRALIQTKKMHSRFDRMPGREAGFHYLVGWAYLEDVDNKDTSVVLVITDKDRKAHYMHVKRSPRPDLEKACGDSRCLWGGIHAVFDIPDFPDGSYAVRILIRCDGKLYTDGKVYRGNYKSAPSRFSLAFLGGVTRAKGSGLIGSMIHSGKKDYNYYIFGEIGDSGLVLPEGTDNVFFSGIYRREDVGLLLKAAGVSLVVIPPIWAETFCYTLSEAWSCGIPVIGTDIGAVGERIRETGAGWLLKPDAGEKELTELLDHIVSHPEELAEKKALAEKLKLKSIAQMDAEYRSLYESIPEGSSGSREDISLKERDEVFQAYAMANPSVRGSSAAAAMNGLREENEKLSSYIEMLENTSSYRFARKISEADIPFKEQLKKLVKKIR